jgi:hypothetical protein
MNAPDGELARMEQLRQRFGFWVDVLRVRQIVNWLLAWVALDRRHEGTLVRMRCWSDVLAFNEIFRAGIYDVVFDAGPVATTHRLARRWQSAGGREVSSQCS